MHKLIIDLSLIYILLHNLFVSSTFHVVLHNMDLYWERVVNIPRVLNKSLEMQHQRINSMWALEHQTTGLTKMHMTSKNFVICSLQNTKYLRKWLQQKQAVRS